MNKKVTFSENLYLGESIDSAKLDKLKKEILKKPALVKAFLITISTNPSEQLDITETKYLSFPYYKKHPLYVIGIAGSGNEALHLIEKIALDCLHIRGDANMRAFLQERSTDNCIKTY